MRRIIREQFCVRRPGDLRLAQISRTEIATRVATVADMLSLDRCNISLAQAASQVQVSPD